MNNKEKTIRTTFFNYTAEAVQSVLRDKGETYEDLANKICVSESFVLQVSSRSSSKHWNAYLLFRIALLERIPISYLFPPIDNTKKSFVNFRNITGDSSYKDFIKMINKFNY